MDSEGKCGLLLITWNIITGICLFVGTSTSFIIAGFITVIAAVIAVMDEKNDRERERGDRYRARFLKENRREQ